MKCPKCGSRMTERKNSITGTSFMGCTRWPSCRQTVSTAEPPVSYRGIGVEYVDDYGEQEGYMEHDELREY